MVGYNVLSRDDISVIASLNMTEHYTGYFQANGCHQGSLPSLGVAVREVQRYVKVMTEIGDNRILERNITPGKTRKTYLLTN